MDPQLDLLPTALFSPSKAAQQRAAAQEWHQADTWLSAKFQGRSIPAFERNPDTLKALLMLAAANEKADEEREMVMAVQREALAEMKGITTTATTKPRTASGMLAMTLTTAAAAATPVVVADDGNEAARGAGILKQVDTALAKDGKAALEALAMAATALDAEDESSSSMPSSSLSSLASALSVRTETSQGLAQHLHSLTQLHHALTSELHYLRASLSELRSPAFQSPLSLQRQTLDWTRNTKQLRSKLNEYSDRLISLSGGSGSGSGSSGSLGANEVGGIVEREDHLAELEEKDALLRAKVEAFKGLPKDRDEALDEIRKLEDEVANLKAKMDRLFERLVEKA